MKVGLVQEEGRTWSSYTTSSRPSDTRDAHICAAQLNVWYGDKLALHDVTLAVDRGTIAAVVGPSGCGKTSFLMCVNRLTDMIPRCRVSGALHLDHLNLMSPTIDVLALRRRVGMVFQKPNPFPLSVWSNLALPLKEHGVFDRDEQHQRIETVLRDVGLWNDVKDRLGHSALALSGGQQQRVCLARALVLSPEVLLLDEPCSSLDPLSSGMIEDLIVSLRGRLTIVIVTHHLAQARRIADSVAVFWAQAGAGWLVESGPTQQIFDSPQHPITAAYIQGHRG